MKTLYNILIILLITGTAWAQQKTDHSIHFRSGTVTPQANISTEGQKSMRLNLDKSLAQGQLLVIQFDQIPDAAQRAELAAAGIELLDYIPNRAYTAVLKKSLSVEVLERNSARAIFPLEASQKLDPALLIPSTSTERVEVWVRYVEIYKKDEVRTLLKEQGYELLADPYEKAPVLVLRLKSDELLQLAAMPQVQYVQAAPGPDEAINNKSMANSRANVLNSTALGGHNLLGRNIVVGVGDNANPFQHVDFTGRIINHAGLSGGTHGVHVMGTLAGAGIMDERYKGYAPKATLVVQNYSKIFTLAPSYVADYGMVITNNSYGSDVSNCETFGEYDLYSQILDQQAFDMPQLQHIFASGNSGTISCSPLPAGFGNVLGGYQASKNVLTVGNTTDAGIVATTSSRGPVRDGRLKPEIMAQGSLVRSTVPTDAYGNSTGTSMAAPGVSGGLALLYERYKQLYGGINPKNGLMKALLCNGATDLGNVGPDYKYGFGWMNLVRSISMLETANFRNDSLSHSQQKQITVNVPANTAQLKVMLYWNDPAASVLSAQALVNNLDLTVTTPASLIKNPLILSSDPTRVNDLAVEGVDNLNNIEQVVIDSPAAGNYTFTVKGTNVVQNPRQAYFLVYDAVPVSTQLTFPIGKEKLVGGEGIKIAWDSFGDNTSTYQVQYSTDLGASWTAIGSPSLPATTRQLDWTLPNIASDQVKVRVIQNLTGLTSTSDALTILGQPLVSLSAAQSEGYMSIDWTSVAGATDYEVMLLVGDEMISKGIVTGNTYVFSGLSKDLTYYATVRARLNTNPGRRAIAVSHQPGSGDGVGASSDHDLMVERILLPTASGRNLTSTALSASQQVMVRIKNLDDDASNPVFVINFSVNDNVIYSQTVNHSIPAGGVYDHIFPVTYNFSAVGSYKVAVIISHSGDPVTSNNSLIKTYKQLANLAVTLPFADSFESLTSQAVLGGQVGLAGGDRYDLVSSESGGRLRTYIGSGIAATGNRAITLDVDRYTATGVTNYLIGTYNLAAYDVNVIDLRLDFKYKNHGTSANEGNKVWVRGNDSAGWIEAFDLFANQNGKDEGYRTASGIEISRLLSDNGQTLTTSFQIRWGQWGTNIAADWNSADGYTFDDLVLYTATDDMQLMALNTPAEDQCSYGAAEAIQVTLRNSAAMPLLNVPVTVWVDGGSPITEYIASIAARSNMNYTFNAVANMSAPGQHTVKVRVDYPSDSYAANNELTKTYFHAPLVTAFPYLQDFETNDGYFYADGRNSSWAYGNPAAVKIAKAASGSKAWKTNLSGAYNDNEQSYLYSPCFNIGGLVVPMLSFSLALDMEVCDPDPCDVAYVEYSGDGGAWVRLGAQGQGTNWYDLAYGGSPAWSADQPVWHMATIPLPTGFSTIRLRFVMQSDPFVQNEGIALDDIHIYDLQGGIYDETTMAGPVSESLSPSANWVDFKANGKLVASVKSGSQNLGVTDVQAYRHTGSIRNVNDQYYLNRNITIKPQNTSLTDSVEIRLYFLESEVEQLLAATGCAACPVVGSAYELGVAKYTNSNKLLEDGDLGNNGVGGWLFQPSVQKVPFDKGYYVQLKVKDFSEFWFSKGILGTDAPLPVKLAYFRASIDPEIADQVHLSWETTLEDQAAYFEVEVAAGDEALRQNSFSVIGKLLANGEVMGSSYQHQYRMPEPGHSYYFRLKMVDLDGTYAYSSLRSVTYKGLQAAMVYPNPVTDRLTMQFQTGGQGPVQIRLIDLNGQVLHMEHFETIVGAQKWQKVLDPTIFGPGLYVVELISGGQKQRFKFIKK